MVHRGRHGDNEQFVLEFWNDTMMLVDSLCGESLSSPVKLARDLTEFRRGGRPTRRTQQLQKSPGSAKH